MNARRHGLRAVTLTKQGRLIQDINMLDAHVQATVILRAREFWGY